MYNNITKQNILQESSQNTQDYVQSWKSVRTC